MGSVFRSDGWKKQGRSEDEDEDEAGAPIRGSLPSLFFFFFREGGKNDRAGREEKRRPERGARRALWLEGSLFFSSTIGLDLGQMAFPFGRCGIRVSWDTCVGDPLVGQWGWVGPCSVLFRRCFCVARFVLFRAKFFLFLVFFLVFFSRFFSLFCFSLLGTGFLTIFLACSTHKTRCSLLLARLRRAETTNPMATTTLPDSLEIALCTVL